MTEAVAAAGIIVRDAVDADLDIITRIYAHHVRHGLGTFEETAPDHAEHVRRFRSVRADRLPYLVAELDGGVRGYAHAMPYRPRSAYRYTVENSIYIDPDWYRRGLANTLMVALIARCTEAGKRQMIAVIGDSANAASIGLHARHGFRLAGTLPSAGFKFDRWVDSVIMCRALGDGAESLPSI